MSWFGRIPETPSDEFHQAVDEHDPLNGQVPSTGVVAQIETAKEALHLLHERGTVKGTKFTAELSGHSDPGDQSTAADSVRVALNQVR